MRGTGHSTPGMEHEQGASLVTWTRWSCYCLAIYEFLRQSLLFPALCQLPPVQPGYWYQYYMMQTIVIPRYSSASELMKPCTCCILMRKKNVSAVGASSGLVALARTYMSHDVLHEKMLYCSELVGFGSHHEFWNELTMSTEVPPYVIYWKRQNGGDNKQIGSCLG